MAQKRVSEKGRAVLRKGEGQRPNGSYYYRWSDKSGSAIPFIPSHLLI